jgi:hypothetical protein
MHREAKVILKKYLEYTKDSKGKKKYHTISDRMKKLIPKIKEENLFIRIILL